MPRFAANLTTMFTEVAYLDRFAAAADAGFKACEFLFPYEYPPHVIAKRMKGAGIDAILFNLPPGDWAAGERGIAALASRKSEFRRSVDLAAGFARELGVSRLHAMAGLTESGADRAVYVDNLRFAAERLLEDDIELLIEPISAYSMPGYFLSDLDEAVRLIAEVEAPNLRIQADLYHLRLMGGDVPAALRRNLALISHIQIAGTPDRHEPDTGEMDYAPIFALLDELQYAGWIGCEYRPLGATRDGLGWLKQSS